MSARPEDRNPRDVLIDALDSWIRPDAAADVALAALRAAGYVVVPAEPTEAMIDAGSWECVDTTESPEGTHVYREDVAGIYRAMLNAALPAPLDST